MGENALRKASKRVGALFLIAAVAMIAIMIGIVSFLLSSSNAATQGVAKKNAEEVMQNRVENIIGRIDTLRADDEVAYEHEIDHVMETLGNASEATLLESARNDANLELTDDGTAVPFVEIDDASGSAVWRNGDVSSSAADVLDLRRASVGSYTISAFTTQGAVDDLVKGEIRKEIYASKYGQNQYVWVNEVVNYDGGDDYAIRRIHPNLSDTEGQYLSTNMEDAAGNHPYESELEGVKANGSIFQSYYFQNMSDKKIALKYSFAELYKPYNWIIATGIPLSDLYSVANEQSSQDQRLVSYVVGFAVVIVALLVGIAIVTVRRNLAIERSKEEERDLALRFENVLLGEIRRIDEPTELSTRLARLTQDLCESFGADRACILNVAGMRASEAYEWHREGAPASSPCEGEGDACAVPWAAVLESPRLIEVDDVRKIREAHPREHAFLVAQGIRSLVIAPVMVEGRAASLICVINPGEKTIRYLGPILLSLSHFVSDAMLRSRESSAQRTKYELVVEGAGIGIFEYHIKERRIDLPGARHRAIGLPDVLEGVPEPLLPLMGEGERKRFLAFAERIRAGAANGEESFWISWRPEMPPRCERIVFTAQRNAEGEPTIAYGIMQNVTKQKEAERHYSRMVEQITDSYPNNLGTSFLNLTQNVCVDVKSPYEWVRELKGDSTVDGIVSGIASRVPNAEERRRLLRGLDRMGLLAAFEAGKTSFSVDYPVLASDGKELWVRTWVYMLQNPDTDDVEAHTSTVAIDEERSYEIMVRALTREVYGFVILLDMVTGKIRFGGETGSGASEQYRDQDYESAAAAALEQMVPAEQLGEAVRAHSVETIRERLEEASSYQLTLATKDGRTLRWLMTYVDEERTLVLIARSDVTEAVAKERRQAEQLRDALDRAEQATAAEQRFLSNMSHDLRTPLNGIIGFTDLALNTDDDASRQGYLEKASLSGRLMLDLVNDILDLSKLESGKMDLRPETCDSGELFSATTESVSLMAQQRDVRFVAHLDPAFPRFIRVDRLRIQQVALNLLSNAIKYTPDGGEVDFEARRLEGDPDGHNALLHVSDNGIGMSEEFQRRMFEPFAQEHQSRMYGVQGTGLGLSVVKSLVDLMGGRIEVESELGEGTSFKVFLTLPEVEGALSAGKQEERPLADISGKRILLCEDNSLNAEISSTVLRERAGAKVVLARDGKEGLDLFCASEPGYFDAILMDLRMPVMDGIAATKAIRGLERGDARRVPIIAMTADAFAEDARRCLEAGMDAHVAKPIEPRELICALGEAIAARR
jgi:signal transduction histidine kinase/CheY-like chemotaxis protein